MLSAFRRKRERDVFQKLFLFLYCKKRLIFKTQCFRDGFKEWMVLILMDDNSLASIHFQILKSCQGNLSVNIISPTLHRPTSTHSHLHVWQSALCSHCSGPGQVHTKHTGPPSDPNSFIYVSCHRRMCCQHSAGCSSCSLAKCDVTVLCCSVNNAFLVGLRP